MWLVSGTGLVYFGRAAVWCFVEEEGELPAKSRCTHRSLCYCSQALVPQKLLKPMVLFRDTSLPALLMVLSLVFSPLSSPLEQAWCSSSSATVPVLFQNGWNIAAEPLILQLS